MWPYIDKIISLITGEHPSSPPPQPGPRSETINSALFPTKSANDIPADMYNEGAYENEYFTIEETRTYAYISAVIVNYRFSTKRDFKMMLAHQWWFSGKDDNGNEYRDDTGTPFGPICRLESNKCKDDQFKSYPANVDKNLWAALGIVNPDKWDKNKPKYIYVLFNFLVRDGDVTKLIQIPIKSEMGQ